MAGYTKLFNSILASTIWREPNHVRIVWITLLAMADKNGAAEGSVPGLADFARVSIDECRDALHRLQDPDRDSRSQEFDGRRIAEIDGGWLLLNHEKYRQKLNEDERREYLRIKKAESRGRQRDVNKSAEPSTPVNTCPAPSTPSTQAEAEAEADTEAKATTTKSASSSSPVPLILSQKRLEKLKETHAYVGSRLRIPHVLHDELRTKLGGDMADLRLMDWYQLVNDELDASQTAIPDVFKVVRPRFEAWVGPAKTVRDPRKAQEQTQLENTLEVKRLMAEGMTRIEATAKVYQ